MTTISRSRSGNPRIVCVLAIAAGACSGVALSQGVYTAGVGTFFLGLALAVLCALLAGCGNQEPTKTPLTTADAVQIVLNDLDLTIDQANYFAFYVDDIDQAQSVPGLKEKYQEKAVHGLAVARDTFVANLIKSATNVTTATALTQEAVKKAIDDAIVALRERNFDEAGVIEITPAVYNVFKNLLITLSTDNPEYIKKGKVGVYDDFDVIMSNNMAKDTNHAYCDIRGKKAIAFAGQINEVEALRAEKRFKDIVRGLDTFGGKVIDNARIQVIKVPLKAS